MSDKIIYRLDDEISFKKCSLFDECSTDHGDCTNFTQKKYISMITISAIRREYIFIVPNILRLNWNMTPALMELF